MNVGDCVDLIMSREHNEITYKRVRVLSYHAIKSQKDRKLFSLRIWKSSLTKKIE